MVNKIRSSEGAVTLIFTDTKNPLPHLSLRIQKYQKGYRKKIMAVSLGLFSVFSTGETALFAKAASFSSIRLASPLAAHHANLRTVRTVTFATASKPAAEPKKREPRGIMKPRRVSPEMQAFLGGMSEVPRTQALKLIWAHIKANDLQDPQDKKVIICDEKLKTIFGGKERVGFLEIAGLISPHFLK